MKRFFFFCALGLLCAEIGHAQDFITRGKVEFEIKRNLRRMYADMQPSGSEYPPEMPEFDISYGELIFAWNQSLYQKTRKGSASFPDASVYTDLDKGQVVRQVSLDEPYVYIDSIRKIRWKISNETRKIAGWECRKAVGRMDDSVYVVAFYCPEIIPQSGPGLISGLPGMILGLAIPRYYTTWFATKIEIASIDESKIVPPSTKKGKVYSRKELAEVLYKKDPRPDFTVEKMMQMIDIML